MRMRNLIAFSMLLILSGCFARSKPGSKVSGRQPVTVDVQGAGNIAAYAKVPINQTTLEDYRIKGHCDSGVDFDFTKKNGGTKPISSDTCKTRLMWLKFKNPTTSDEVTFSRHDFTNTEWDTNKGDVIRMKDDAKQITLFVAIDQPLDNPVQPSSTIKYFFTSILQGPDHVREERRISIGAVTVEGVDAPLFAIKASYRALDGGEMRLKIDMECLENLVVRPAGSTDLGENKCYSNALSNISYVLVPDQTGVVPSKISEVQDYFDSRQACTIPGPARYQDPAGAYLKAENNLRAAQTAVDGATLIGDRDIDAKKQTLGTNLVALWSEYKKENIPMVTTKQYCSPMFAVPTNLVLLPTAAGQVPLEFKGGFSTFYMEMPWNDLRKKQRMMLILRAKGTGAHANDYSYSMYSITLAP